MKLRNLVLLCVFAGPIVALAGCGKSNETAQVASPTCADLQSITDPAKRAELDAKCPRNGASFVASPAKSY